jgi:hypothetical protein
MVDIAGQISPTGVQNVEHPEYQESVALWEKWRLTYTGGLPFVNRYLKQFSTREDTTDFEKRKELTYIPAFASQAIDEIAFAIMQRMSDVTRTNGPDTWQAAIRGELGGVDLLDSTMNGFIGKEIVKELLVKSKVGVYVDMPPLSGRTLADKGDKHPYLQVYWAEDIRSWEYDSSFRGRKLTRLLLRDWNHRIDPVSGLPMAWEERYKHIYLNEQGFVTVEYFNCEGRPCDADGNVLENQVPVILELTEIPFVVGNLGTSLMNNICDYQIAMMNMASADVDFCTKANYPFYTEQKDTRVSSDHLRVTDNSIPHEVTYDAQSVAQQAQAEHVAAVTATTPTVKTGVSYGRKYGYGLERPGFIHPSSEPLKASMDKQAQMKAEIREIVHLSVSRLDPAKASAESKAKDENAMENGLTAIGQELEKMERKIARFWAIYEGQKNSVANIQYPTNYSLLTDEERRKAAKELAEQLPVVPSKTYQKEIAKEIAVKLLAHKVPNDVMAKIKAEIDQAQAMTTDSKTLIADLTAGLVSLDTCSELRGYAPGEAEKAKKDHAERLARIAEAQMAKEERVDNAGARGIKDEQADPNEGKQEKEESRDTTHDDVVEDKTRGEGKG